MKKTVTDFFEKEQIKLYSPIECKDVYLRLPHILTRAGFALPTEENTDKPSVKSLLCLCVPYFYGFPENFSVYAASPDYHTYYKALLERLCRCLCDAYPGYTFFGFADSSPFDEVSLCEKAGLGSRGDNMLFLTEEYSSFVFLGEVATDMPYENWEWEPKSTPMLCTHCGACKKACPGYEADTFFCLSALTQKKGELTEKEINIIRKYGSAWGCDICQKVCPVTIKAQNNGSIHTPIDYFKNGRIEKLTRELVESMDDEEFNTRAFSWRGRNTVLRNLKILEKPEK